jgi:hypothetical protein
MRCHRNQIDLMLVGCIEYRDRRLLGDHNPGVHLGTSCLQSLGHVVELVLRLVQRCLNRPIVTLDYLPAWHMASTSNRVDHM